MSTPLLDNRQLGPDTARLNLLTNGGFEIWQRGNGPFSAVANGVGTMSADRWSALFVGTDTLSVSKDTANVDVAQGSTACAVCTFTLSGGGGSTVLYQQLKPGDFALANRTLTLSIRVKTSTASAVRVGIYNGSAYTYSGSHPGDGTWQTLTASATVIAAPTNIYAAVSFVASCTAYVDNAMLVVGSQAADYAPLHPADDLARCLRYYERADPGSNQYICHGFCYAANLSMGMWPMAAQKPTGTPSLTVTPANTWQVTNATFGGIVCTSIAAALQSGRMISITAQVASGLVAGNSSMILGAAGQQATLTCEVNP